MAMEQPAPPRANAGSVVILCAEEATRAAIAYWSTQAPVRTVVAEDGYHANRILQAEVCRLLVTDRVLPPWPGLDTFRQLRERNPDLRIAFIEGASPQESGIARVTGATDLLAWPLRRQSIAAAIDAAMRAA